MSPERVTKQWARGLMVTVHEAVNATLAEHGITPTAELERAMRELVSWELEKVAFRYSCRPGLIAANNVAYSLSEEAAVLRSWVPHWVVRATDREGAVRVFDFDQDEIAAQKEARLLEPDMSYVEVDYE